MKRFLAFYSKSKCMYPEQKDFIGDFESSTEGIAEVFRIHQSQNINDIEWKYTSGFVYDKVKKCMLTKKEVIWEESVPPQILFNIE